MQVGDLCSVPFNIACGRCVNCKEGKTGTQKQKKKKQNSLNFSRATSLSLRPSEHHVRHLPDGQSGSPGRRVRLRRHGRLDWRAGRVRLNPSSPHPFLCMLIGVTVLTFGRYVMVPYADWNLLVLPDKEKAMDRILDIACLSDILPTGYHGAVTAGVTTGSTVYVAGWTLSHGGFFCVYVCMSVSRDGLLLYDCYRSAEKCIAL